MSVGCTSVASFEVISDSISAGSLLAVGSASIGNCVGVGCSIIASLASVENTVSAEESAARGTGGVAIESSEITLFSRVDNTITASWQNASDSASVLGGGVLGTIVALFANIQDSISAEGVLAVDSASGSLAVGVVNSRVALLIGALNTISALNLAVGIATITVHVVAIITVFTKEIISDAITTEWKDTSGSASVGGVGIQPGLVALLLGVDHTITAISHAAVGSATVGQSVIVVGTIITLLSDPGSVSEGHDVLLDSVSTRASGDSWKSVKDWLQDLVACSSLRKQDGQDCMRGGSGVLGLVEQLNFKRESSVSDEVFAGLMEFKVSQRIGHTLVAEGSSVQRWEEDVVSSVEQHKRGWVVLNIGRMVEVECTGTWASLGESDGGLSVTRTSTINWGSLDS